MTTSRDPIWMKTERFFLYPLQPSVALISSCAASIPLWLTTIEGSLGFWALCVSFVLLLSMILFTVLECGMEGSFDPPKWKQSVGESDHSIIFQQTAFICSVLALLFYGQQRLDQNLFYLLGFTLTLFLPAMVMLIGATREITQAFNPIRITELILQLGSTYCVLLGLIYLMVGGVVFIYEQLIEILPWVVAAHWTTFIGIFVCITLFHMMGYVVYLNHEGMRDSSLSVEQTNIQSTHPAIGEIRALIKNNQLDNAYYMVERALMVEPLNIEINDLYHKLCLLREDKVSLEKHGTPYLSFLLQKGYDAKAMEIFLNIYRQNFNYKPENIESVIKMAKLLNESQQYSILIQLLDGLHKLYPKHQHIPKAYGFLAKILHEQLGRDKQATQILEYILVTFPNHPIRHAVKAQLDKIIKGPTKLA